MTDVRRNDAEQRYELEIDGLTAIAAYRMEDGAVAFTHTVVPPELEGRGIGSRLIKGALDDVRARGLRFVPLCTFVAGYAERHPEVRDLLAR
ncbi:GNAT family N-acetyltransferase [Sphingomonas lenta]|uniref:N-acetyltransferase n=1 Tax=Sphingomonas lenta TaxID=1141887 RepID=A0A2A2SEY3_9SPHN|nr:GNAT family N-acetyltransferase [Sphingomonas lenta]PAX07763.1 N-acetyltransferase [Sphingomonas lenta]